MKKVKKGLSLVLTIIMLMSVMPLGAIAAEQWWMPLTSYVSVGDPFGCTCSDHNGRHYGQDFPAYSGTTVRASKSGTVVAVVTYCKSSHYNGSCRCGSSWGNYVKIKHSDGFYSLYAHLSSVSVSNGQSVSQGQKVGGVGTTGDSTGNHLHFEIYNTSNTRVNPLNYINPNNPSPNGQTPIITGKPKLSSNKTAYTLGEKVVLNRNNVNNTNFYWLVVWYNNKQILSTSMPELTYTLTNLETGKYEAYVQVGNSNGTITSDTYIFYVQNSINDKGIITSDKKTYLVGETVTLKRNTINNTNYYWIVLWYKNKQILSTSMPGTTYKLYNLEEGVYDIYLQYGNATTGVLTSEKYVFHIEKPHIHSYAMSVKNSTCTEMGLKTYMCYCGNSYTETIAKTAHNSNTTIPAVAATCTKTGLTAGKKCSVCGTVTVAQQSVAKKAHSYTSTITTQPTCTSTGVKTYKCSCGASYTEKINATTSTHTYKTTTTKATNSKNGKSVTKCTACGYVKSTKTIYMPKTIKLSSSTVTYNGKTRTPSVTVKDSKGNTLKKDTDFTVKYASGRKNPGKYTITVTFKGKYSGTKKLTFTIKPAAPKISKVTSTTKGKANIYWSNVTGASGYAFYYSTSKNGTYTHFANYKAGSKVSTKNSLKSGKTYYFKVKAYTKTSSGWIYSSASEAKSVKIK